jgi:hypothetical protein
MRQRAQVQEVLLWNVKAFLRLTAIIPFAALAENPEGPAVARTAWPAQEALAGAVPRAPGSDPVDSNWRYRLSDD